MSDTAKGTGTGTNSRLDALKVNALPDAFADIGAKHNKLCDLIGGMTGQKGISAIVTTGNIVISLAPDADPALITGAANQALGPLTIYVVGPLSVRVTPGTVNGVMPTLGGTPLNSATPPTLTISATRYLWLKCTGTFGSPDSYVITIEDSATSAVPTGTTITGTGFVSYLLLGYATVVGSAITALTQVNSGTNWQVESYGSVNEWWR